LAFLDDGASVENMSIAGSARLLVAVFVALAIATFVSTRAAFAQDVAESSTSNDANWESVDTTPPPTDAAATPAAPTDPSADKAAPSAEPTTPSADEAAASPAPTASSIDVTAASVDPTATVTDETEASAEPSGPPIDASAASAEKVLEIPQAKCSDSNDQPTAPCDGTDANKAATDDDQSLNAPSPGAPPGDDTAYAAPEPDWGTVDDYQNQQVDNGPYVIYPYPGGVVGTLQRPTQVSSSGFVAMSSPLTQAARPPLNQGPWMIPPTMSTFARPAGSPMMRPTGHMMMSAPLVGFHR
jgi:hypothetical protein